MGALTWRRGACVLTGAGCGGAPRGRTRLSMYHCQDAVRRVWRRNEHVRGRCGSHGGTGVCVLGQRACVVFQDTICIGLRRSYPQPSPERLAPRRSQVRAGGWRRAGAFVTGVCAQIACAGARWSATFVTSPKRLMPRRCAASLPHAAAGGALRDTVNRQILASVLRGCRKFFSAVSKWMPSLVLAYKSIHVCIGPRVVLHV